MIGPGYPRPLSALVLEFRSKPDDAPSGRAP